MREIVDCEEGKNEKNSKKMEGEELVEYLKKYFEQLRGLIRLEDRFERFIVLENLFKNEFDNKPPKIILENEVKIIKKRLKEVKELIGEDNNLFKEIEKIDIDVSKEDVELLRQQTSKLGLEILELEKETELMDLVEKFIENEKNKLKEIKIYE